MQEIRYSGCRKSGVQDAGNQEFRMQGIRYSGIQGAVMVSYAERRNPFAVIFVLQEF